MMMIKYVLFALVALFNCLVYAQQPIVSITAPLQNASFTAGGKLVVSWINPQVDSISQIQLSHGSPQALQPITVIANNVDAKSGSYSWDIPSNLTTGNDYALVLGTSPNLAYTGQFTIKGAEGGSASSAPAQSA
ncbi:hypothetical protein BCR42DRAFT_7488 [Absidia repens]|uniref:Yeast cell wall synthesis Kre9/Knh1-like N-terminal domain-containing protein n=1 Tax=Absidia repens TaxID=90262 RepID=A0A1X2J0Q9_9FUNG|nr:hypothetical protein BCR42DRAFT_7488 [Absidia repens]